MSSECCSILKGFLSSFMGSSLQRTKNDEDREAHPVEYSNEEEISAAPQEENVNYQTIMEFATSGFIVAKNKGKHESNTNVTFTNDQVERLRLKLKNVLFEASELLESSERTACKDDLDDFGFGDKLRRINFITKFSSESGVR